MRTVCGSGLILAIVVFASSAAPAPEAPPLIGVATGILSYLSSPQVRDELKLTEDQLKKIEELKKELKTKRRLKPADLRSLSLEERVKKAQEIVKATEAALAKILTRKQLRRAEQIFLQLRGPMLLRSPQVAAALKLTDEQKEKMKDIDRETFREYRESRKKGDQHPLTELFKRRDEKLLNVLTPAQKKKRKQLLGEPFKWEPRRLGEKK
ncbi:MAG TPA: hypothetical protein VMG10_27850 [Gemmataceae bacterium]|nr:hypothetical protein [Gemmataceae bacterium]